MRLNSWIFPKICFFLQTFLSQCIQSPIKHLQSHRNILIYSFYFHLLHLIYQSLVSVHPSTSWIYLFLLLLFCLTLFIIWICAVVLPCLNLCSKPNRTPSFHLCVPLFFTKAAVVINLITFLLKTCQWLPPGLLTHGFTIWNHTCSPVSLCCTSHQPS